MYRYSNQEDAIMPLLQPRSSIHNESKKNKAGNSKNASNTEMTASEVRPEKTKTKRNVDISKIVQGCVVILSVLSLMLSGYMYFSMYEQNSQELQIIKEVFRGVCRDSDEGTKLSNDCIAKLRTKFHEDYFSEKFTDLSRKVEKIGPQINEMFAFAKNNSGAIQQFTFDEVSEVKKIIGTDSEYNIIQSIPGIKDLNEKLDFLKDKNNTEVLEKLVSIFHTSHTEKNDIRELEKLIYISKDNKFFDKLPQIIKSNQLIETWNINLEDLEQLSALAKSCRENNLIKEIPNLISTNNKFLRWRIEESLLTELSELASLSEQNNLVSSFPRLNKVLTVLVEWNPEKADIDELKSLPLKIKEDFSDLANSQDKHINDRIDKISISQNKSNLPEFLTQPDDISELEKLVRKSQEIQFAENLNDIKTVSEKFKDWQIEKYELDELKKLAVSNKNHDFVDEMVDGTSGNINKTIEEISKQLADTDSQLYTNFKILIEEQLPEKTRHYKKEYSHQFNRAEMKHLKLFVRHTRNYKFMFSQGGLLSRLEHWNPSIEVLDNISKLIEQESRTNFTKRLPQIIDVFENLSLLHLKSEEYTTLAEIIRASKKFSLAQNLPTLMETFFKLKGWLSGNPLLDELSSLSAISKQYQFIETIPQLSSFSTQIPALEQWSPDLNDIEELRKWINVNKNNNFSDVLPHVIETVKLWQQWNPDLQNLQELTSLADTSRDNNLVIAVPQLLSLKIKYQDWDVDSSSLHELSDWAKLSRKHELRSKLPDALKSHETWKYWNPEEEHLHELTLLSEVSKSTALVDAVPGLLSMKKKFENWNIEESHLSELTEWAITSKQNNYVQILPSFNQLLHTFIQWNPQLVVLEELTKWADVTLNNNYVSDLSGMKDIFHTFRKWNPPIELLEELSSWADVSRNHKFVSSLPTFTDTTHSQLANLEDTTNNLGIKILKLENHVYDLRAKDDMNSGRFPTGVVFAIIISVICVIFSTFVLFMRNQHADTRPLSPVGAFIKPIPRSVTPPLDERDVIKPRHSILDEISPRPLQKKICLISFYRETQKAHEMMLQPVIVGGRMQNISLEHVVINKHEQIKSLPAAFVYLVFVDYNQRHIILENPDLGLGDLRLITVRAAKKIGGEVMLLYVGDDGSRNLSSRALFNTNLTSIFQHEELKLLKSKDCVITSYQTLTNYQEQHVRNFLRNILF